MRLVPCLALLALSLTAPRLNAQAAATYRWTASDTLSYHERTESIVTMETPQGTVELRSDHQAHLGLSQRSPDTVQAWYDSLHVAQLVPGQPARTPSTADAIGDPFLLSMSPRGKVAVVTAPEFPADLAEITDLTHQFDDFFVTLPSVPLAPGVEWADTVRQTASGRTTDTYEGTHIRHYRVIGDTVMDGERAVRLAVRSDVQLNASSRVEAQSMTVSTALTGSDEGEALFAPGSGKLLHRQRSGSLTGKLTLEGNAGTVVWPQRYDYTSTIRRVR